MLQASLLLFCGSLIAAAAYAIIVKKASLFDPITQFFAVFALYTIPLPARVCFTQSIEGDVSDQLPYFASYLPIALLLCTAAIPFFMWAYYCSRWPAALAKRLPVPEAGSRKGTYAAFLLICSFSLFLLYKLSGGSVLLFLLRGYNSTAEMFGKGYLASGFPWFFVGTLFLLYRYAVHRQKRDLLLFYCLLLLQIAGYAVLGDRHTILNLVLTVVIFTNFAIQRIRMTRLVALGLTGFVALNFMGMLRQSDYRDFGDFINKTASAAVASKGNDESFFYTLTTGEFVVPFETMPQIIRKFGSDIEPRWGSTYVRAPLFFVPQVIYPNRPPMLLNWYMERFYGRGWGQNQGRQFYFLAEGYLNFGPVGVFLTMLFWGLFLGTVHRYRVLHPDSASVTLLYALTVAFIIKCLGGDFVSLVVGLPEQELIIALLGIILAAVVFRTRVPATLAF